MNYGIDYKYNFYELIDFCEQNKIKVVQTESNENVCFPKINLVVLSTNQYYKNKFFTLSHEIGHIMIYRSKNSWENNFSYLTVDIYDERKSHSKAYCVSLIAEEIEAWKVGKQIIDELDLEYNKECYLNIMNDCVYSYLKDYPN
tara:strand:- start:270 stop:701 length:432 start_codon:yes stop_codon:yes gene_type:complete